MFLLVEFTLLVIEVLDSELSSRDTEGEDASEVSVYLIESIVCLNAVVQCFD